MAWSNYDSDTWVSVSRQVGGMTRKGNALLGLIASKGKGYGNLSPNDEHQQMLGKVDQMRSMLDEVERLLNEIKPETQTKPKTPRHTHGLSAFQILAIDQANKKATQMERRNENENW